MASILILTDGTSDSVSFIGDSTYKLDDATFVADIPSRKETRAELTLSSGRDLISLSYNNRTIRFSFYVVGTTDVAIRDAITKVGRLLLRTHSPIYINGGSYSSGNTYTDGQDAGDNGLILRCRLSEAAGSGTITTELGTTPAPSNIMTYRIVSGDLKVLRPYSAQRKMSIDGASKYFALCEISLEAEPFALGQSRVVAQLAAPGFVGSRLRYNRFHIPAANVPGDGPALTRISTTLLNSNAITIARDAGVSLLNSCSAPTQTVGSGKNDLFVYATHKSSTIYSYEIEITGTGTPNQYTWRRRTYNLGTNAWGSYGSTTTLSITAGTIVNFDPSVEVYLYFANSTGHTSGDKWYFDTHQVGILTSSVTTNLATSPDSNYLIDGRKICTVDFTIPLGCKSKYKIVAGTTFSPSTPTVELMSRVSYIGVNPSNGALIQTQPIFSDWVLRDFSETQLGVVDLTPSGAGFTNHPLSFGRGRVEIFLRAISNVITSPATEITVGNVHLIPIQDQDGCMDAAWAYDGTGSEIYCNYDYNNPYIAEADRNFFSSGYNGNSIINDLDYSSSAGPITLIPGVDNTVVFLPKIAGIPGNWRYAAITSAGQTGNTYLAIRPRYLHGS